MNENRLKHFNQSIFLTGFMAVGKSSIGEVLAQRLNLPFTDIDSRIEKTVGKPIRYIFKEEGEAFFRQKEWEQVQEVTRTFRGVVALGGGALHNQQVVDHLKNHGVLVFVKAPMEVIIERVMRNKKRPVVLDTSGKLKSPETLFRELNTLYLKRIGYYNQAQITLEAHGGETKEQLASLLIEKL